MNMYVAFLRGVNVGGKNTVRMADLKSCFDSLGYTAVRTYINSGNVLFSADSDSERELERNIEAALHAQFGQPITAMVRSRKDINGLLAHVPQRWLAATPEYKFEFFFLHHSVDNPDVLKNFSPKTDIEELLYFPRTLLWFVNRAAITRSNVIRVIGTPLYSHISVRSANTVRKIAELMG